MSAQAIRPAGADQHPLEKLYTFRNRADVLVFLDHHPGLAPLLEEAYTKIPDYFPGSPLYLEFHADPEEPNLDALVLYIGARDDHNIILNRLEEEWFLDAADFDDGYDLILETLPAESLQR